MFSQRRSHYWSQQSRTFFFKGFSAKQQKKPKKAANYSVIEQNALSDKHPKMTGQNDRPDESLTGQAHDQAGHCPLTGRYFEPCCTWNRITKYTIMMNMVQLKCKFQLWNSQERSNCRIHLGFNWSFKNTFTCRLHGKDCFDDLQLFCSFILW